MASGKKKKKKNMITLLSLCAALIVLIVAYIQASEWKEKKTEEENTQEDTSISFASVETADIDTIRVTGGEYSYAVAARDNVWVMEEDEEFPLNTALLDTMAETLGDFRATRLVLFGAEDLSEYGLETPSLTVEVNRKDGTRLAVRIGDSSSADGGYYACIDGESDVYLIAAETRECFYLSEEDLLLPDSAPAFTASDAAGLKVVSDTYRSFTIKDSTDDLKDLTGMALYTLGLYDVYDEPARVDLTNFETLMENYTSISLGELVSWHEADAAEYGLDAPKTALTVWYTETDMEDSAETKEFTIYFGGYSEDESKVYVRLDGSNHIFAMPAEDAETLLAADTFSALSKYTQMVNISTIAGLNITYGGTTRVCELTHETAEGESGGTTTDYFTVDGKALAEEEESDAFRDLYQALIGLKISGELTEGAKTGGDAVLALTFLENDTLEALLEVRYLPIAGDEEHYAVEENGTCRFIADAADVDAMVEQLKEYQP